VFVRARSRGHPSPPTGRLLIGDPFGGAASGRASEAPSSASHRPADLCTRPSSYCSRSWRFRLFDCFTFTPTCVFTSRPSPCVPQAGPDPCGTGRETGRRPRLPRKFRRPIKKAHRPDKETTGYRGTTLLGLAARRGKTRLHRFGRPYRMPGLIRTRATSDPRPITGASVAAYFRPDRPVPRRRSQASFRLPSVASHRPATLLLPGIALLFLFRAFSMFGWIVYDYRIPANPCQGGSAGVPDAQSNGPITRPHWPVPATANSRPF
jgi:hypothetical protein